MGRGRRGGGIGVVACRLLTPQLINYCSQIMGPLYEAPARLIIVISRLVCGDEEEGSDSVKHVIMECEHLLTLSKNVLIALHGTTSDPFN